ncbi:MAG: EamA family transporter [Bacteroidetes bacterium]|nr:EamA family transporter [Bacteroidota bacterium]
MKNKLLAAHLALLAVALIYGSNYSIAKLVLDPGYLTPKALVLLRIITGLVLFTGIHFFFVREKVQKKDWGRMALCGLFGVAANQMFFLLGLRLTTPIHASLIMTTTPILVLLIATVLAAERLTTRKGVGTLLGLAGAAWLITQKAAPGSSAESTFWGDLFIFINASCYGIYLVLVNQLMKKYNPFTVIRWVFSFGILYVLPFATGDLLASNWAAIGPDIWKAIAFVLLATTFLAYLFNTYALGIVNPSTVSAYIYLQPLFAGLISIWMGQEKLNPEKIIAGSLIFLGVYLVSTKGFRRKAGSVER